MLISPLIHPPLLAALARAGHGATVLLADGHFPVSTATGPNAEIIHLNLSPGVVDVPTVLAAVRQVIAIETATVMVPPAGEAEPAAIGEYRAADIGCQFTTLDRFAFYRATSGPDLAIAVATADIRTYSNLLLTVGVRAI